MSTGGITLDNNNNNDSVYALELVVRDPSLVKRYKEGAGLGQYGVREEVSWTRGDEMHHHEGRRKLEARVILLWLVGAKDDFGKRCPKDEGLAVMCSLCRDV